MLKRHFKSPAAILYKISYNFVSCIVFSLFMHYCVFCSCVLWVSAIQGSILLSYSTFALCYGAILCIYTAISIKVATCPIAKRKVEYERKMLAMILDNHKTQENNAQCKITLYPTNWHIHLQHA